VGTRRRSPKLAIQSLLLSHPRLYYGSRRTLSIGRHLSRRPHEPDFAYFAKFRGSGGLFLDVGANSGNSALGYSLFDSSSRILSLEPNPFHASDLRLVRRILGPRFQFRLIGAGDRAGEFTLHVPVYGGIPLTGEASLHPQHVRQNFLLGELGRPDDELDVAEVRVTVHPLDDLALAPHAIKIDVEGNELAVLRGGRGRSSATGPTS